MSATDEAEGTTGENPLGLGLRFTKEAPGLVARFNPKPGHRGPPGYLHGGIAATVLDETMASLGWALDDVPCVTATLELRYRKPVPLDGRELRIEAWRDKPEAKRTQRVRGRLLLADGTVCVEATGIFVQSRR
ncbi:MAG: PaaI family thioesterase [Actinomycetota bacterium]|nr:PaaI family thioesterase [Actinomycetota bacterium]